MIEEIWRPVVGYEGLYEISSYGRVRSLDMYVKIGYGNDRLHKGKVLNPAKDTGGYLKVHLYCNGKQKTIDVHRLVAQAFLPNPDNLPQVNHKDEDKTNNNVTNLEFCTAKYNLSYGTARIRERDTKIKNGYYTGLSKEEYRKKWCQENKDKIREINRRYYLNRKKEMIQNNVH